MHHQSVRGTGKCIIPWAFKIAATLSANINRDRYGPPLIALVFIEWWGGGAPFCTFLQPCLLFLCLFWLPLSLPLSDRRTAGSDPWLFAYSAERRSLCMCVSGCVYIFSLYVCACVLERLCTGNMCLNCQQREYTAKNKNSSVSIQWVCVCLCLCARILCLHLCQFVQQRSELSLRRWGLPSLCCEWWQTAQRGVR